MNWIHRERGIVLPAVLVMLMLVTTVVLFMVRRGTTDERLATNVRDMVTMETAAQYVLRHCERWLWISPPGLPIEAGMPNPPLVIAPRTPVETPAWQEPALVAAANVLPAASLAAQLGARIDTGRCIIEDASNELTVSQLESGNLPSTPDWRKYRITAIVTSPGMGAEARFARAQSEIRMLIGG